MEYTEVNLKAKVQGHLRVIEKETGNVLLDQHNDINAENFSYAIASALVGLNGSDSKSSGCIRYMEFGNGGARVTSSNKYIYSVPQTVGRAASLYNEIESLRRDLIADSDEKNFMNVTHASGNDYTDIVVHVTLDKNEANEGLGISLDDGSIVTNSTISEIGLVTNGGDLITHLCFFPVQKTLKSSLIFEYLIRIQII